MKTAVIKMENIKKDYNSLNEKIEVLKGINFSFHKGTLYAIKGHSGSGKTTLIKILGLMDSATSGEYYLYNNSITSLTDKIASFYRMKYLGFIFQDYNLHPFLNACENVIVPMIINKDIPKKERVIRARNLLKKVGIDDRWHHFPKELSGGEQQRVAIARALANEPEIIIADEPTGNLDKKNEKVIFQLLRNMANEGKCIIVVTHSDEIAKYADKFLLLENGLLTEVKNDK